MSSFKVPEEFKPNTHPAEDWEKWRKRFMIYYGAANIASRNENQQRDILLHIIGDVGLELFETLQHVEPESGKVEAILETITRHYRPYRNITYKRHEFGTAVQKENNSVDQFVTELSQKAKDCEFGDLTESLIRDRLICGLRDMELRERLLREGDLPLPKAISMCRAHEISKNQSQVLTPTSEAFVHATQSKQGRSKRTEVGNSKKKPEKEKIKCKKCMQEHAIMECPAYRRKCNKCFKYNHFAVACTSNKVKERDRQIDTIQTKETVSEEDEYFIGAMVDQKAKSENDWLAVIKVGGNKCLFKLDTGSHVNILPVRVYDKLLNQPTITKTKSLITSYSDHRIETRGSCQLECTTEKGAMGVYEFEVVDTRFRPILGAKACVDLKLVKRIHSLEKIQDTSQLMEEFKEVFEGLGRVPGYHKVNINPECKPTVSNPRRIPMSLQESVKNELDSMEKRGIIVKVETPTEWVHPMVVVKKPNGGVRICLDPRQLNTAIRRSHLQLPTQETLLAKLKGAKVFTVLDAKSAFHQVALDRKSSEICTFATPFGRYRYTRLPFGLKSAPEVFQNVINRIMQDLPGTLCYFDDVLIYGSTQEEHDQRLRGVLERARSNNLKFDQSKLQLSKTSVRYLGNTLSKEGVRILPSRVTAISSLSQPNNKKELQRFLGMINYLAKFLPHVASKTQYLRQLLKKNNPWEWDSKAKEDFENLKAVVSEAPALAYFDPKKMVTLAADASQYGLGATMMQEGKPVAYASATLTETQRSYAQIEKELLAIVYACEHFHYYIYGRECVIETDHRPLVSIAHKPIERLSPRIQRMIVRLQRYQTKIIYVPGNKQFIADTLSRDPEQINIDTDYLENETGAVHQLVRVTPNRLETIKEATLEDEKLTQLMKYCQSGWPQKIHTVPKSIRSYWPYKDEIYVEENLVFRGLKLIIPERERTEVLRRLHESHLGIVACKDRARQIVFWPGITEDIEQYVKKCEICSLHPRACAKEPLLPHPICKRPWEKIGIDFMGLGQKEYIIAIDYHSKYIEIQQMGKTTAGPVITFVKSICARHGKPQTVITDNGPPFEGHQFRDFMASWEIQHVTSSPHYAKSNGMVERAVQTLKTRLKKSLKDGTDPYLVLLNYRATPHAGLDSPGELLMGRRLATMVPTTEKLLEPKYDVSKTLRQLEINQSKQKDHADRNSKSLRTLAEGENVVFEHKQNEWKKGTILAMTENPRSYQLTTPEGKTFRRNRIHIRPTIGDSETKNESENAIPHESTPVNKSEVDATALIPIESTPVMEMLQPHPTPTKDRIEMPQPHPTPTKDRIEMPQPHTTTPSKDRITRSGRAVKKPVRLADYVD